MPSIATQTDTPAAPTAPVIPSFRGHYPAKLEASGRLLLPTAFKGAFDRLATLRPVGTSHLMLWTPAAFMATLAAYGASGPQTVSGPKAAKNLHIGSFDVVVDKQHRFVIPPDLKARVGLGTDIVLAGSMETIEIWSAEGFAEHVQPLLDEADLFFEGFEGIEGT